MARIKNRRRKYLVNKKLQLQFAWLLIMQAAIPIILLGGSLYVVNKMYLSTVQRIAGDAALSDAYIQSILSFSILAMVTLLLITGILLAFIGIRFSHHVAGPIYKLEMSMDGLVRGEKVEPLHFRRTDVVDGLAEKFNAIIEKFNQTQ
jgi:signal transduction histidine kinase